MNKGNLRIGISTDDVERMADELEDDLEDVVDEAAQELRSTGLKAAKDHIRKHDRVWNREVLNSWVPLSTRSIGGAAGVTLYGFQNNADHAQVVDKGATYTDKKPPIDELMPWVMKNTYPRPGQTYRDVAFLIQQSIYENGLDGIGYTLVAKKRMEAEANKEIDKQTRKKFGGPS